MKDVMGSFTLNSNYAQTELAVRADTGHILRVSFQVNRESFDAKVDAVKKLRRDQLNTGLIFVFKSWQGDSFGDIGQHCMYLRGYNAENDSLIGHNSLGQYEPLYQVDIKGDRKISFLTVEVLHCECITGS